MLNIVNGGAWDVVSKQLHAKEQEKAVVAEMTRMVEYILSMSPDDGLRWGGTKYDLLELLKRVYDKGCIVLDDGSTAGFLYLMNRSFAVLHETVVSNPYAKARHAMERKGLRAKCLMERMRCVMASGEKSKIEAFCNTLIINCV